MPRAIARALLLVVVLLAAIPAACSNDNDERTSITAARLDPHPTSAISAVLHVETDAASTVSATVDGPGGPFEIPAGDSATTHDIPIIGMRAESKYTIAVHAAPPDGGAADDQVLDLTTGSLPADLPPITIATASEARMAPGYTVFNVMSFAPAPEGEPPGDAGFLAIVDNSGAVVWYVRLPLQVLDVDTTPRGTFLVTAGESLIQEIDLMGEVVREWGSHIATGTPGKDVEGRVLSTDATQRVDIDSSHHEVTELPNGNILTLSTELLDVTADDARRLCPDNPETSVVGDVVVELSADGVVVQDWPLSAVYDPATTPGSEMCIVGIPIAPPNWFYPDAKGTRDWTHANSVTLDAERNTLIVSSRHLDQVIGLRYHDDDDGKAGELLWSLGVGGTIDLEGDEIRHQHAVELEEDGSLLMYDNGNFRPGTVLSGGQTPAFSRAVRYAVDLEARTATQVWEHRDIWPDGRPVFTPFLGDVDLEPNGNVLITHGGGSSTTGVLMGRIIEVVPGDAPDGSSDETVFDITIGDGTAPGGWTLYRAERLPSLYFARSLSR